MKQALLLILLSVISAILRAQTVEPRCPLIRPEALTQQQVDAIVVMRISNSIGRKLEIQDFKKTYRQLDGTGKQFLEYVLAVASIGEDLGKAGVEKADKRSYEVLTIEDMQKISWSSYTSSKAESIYDARESEKYPFINTYVSTPFPSTGWKLLACNAERIIFQQTNSQESDIRFARVIAVGLPATRTQSQLTDEVKKNVGRSVPAGSTVKILPSRSSESKFPLCVDAIATGITNQKTFESYMRFCYVHDSGQTGFVSNYTFVGDKVPAMLNVEAARFLDGVRYKR
jgi:hypothetical protein